MSMIEHRHRLLEIGEKYRAWGYEVVIHPSERDLPAFLRGYRPDLLARRAGDHVLVDVKSSASRSQMSVYRDLTERIREHPGWRLDLIVSTPSDPAAEAPEYPLLGAESSRARLDDAERLLESGDAEAALLLAWAATEGYLRSLAAGEDAVLPRQGTGRLVKQLATLGAVSRSQFERLQEAMRPRNAVAHGFAATGVHESAREIIDLGRQLLSEDGREELPRLLDRVPDAEPEDPDRR